jgi:hypothetical protein
MQVTTTAKPQEKPPATTVVFKDSAQRAQEGLCLILAMILGF